MHSLQATGDIRKVALWLGHASIRSTEIYLRADPTEKLEALAKLGAPVLKKSRYKAPDKLIAMLKATASPENYAEWQNRKRGGKPGVAAATPHNPALRINPVMRRSA